MPWYFYALLAPFLYTCTNFIDKFLIDKKTREPLALTVLSSLASGLIGLITLLILKFPLIGIYQTLLIILAGMLLAFYLYPYYEAMKVEDTSTVIPLFQFIPVFTLVVSAIFLKETLGYKQIIGLVLVVISGILLSSEKVEAGIFRPRKALWFMIASSFMYGMVGIFFRFVSKDVSFWVVLAYEYVGTGIAGLILLSWRRVRLAIFEQSSVIKSSILLISVNNALAIVAQMAEVYAVTLVIVPLVSLVGSIQPVFALVGGLALSKWFPKIVKEDVRNVVVFHKLFSILLIFVGLYIVYF